MCAVVLLLIFIVCVLIHSPDTARVAIFVRAVIHGEPSLPISLIQVLSEQLYRRLSSVDLFSRHVQVIHEYDTPLPHRRPEHTLPAAIELRHDYKLGLVRTGLGGHVNK